MNCSEEAQRAHDSCAADIVASHARLAHRARMEAERTARAAAIAQNFIAVVVGGETEKLSQLGSPAFVRDWMASVAEKRVDTTQWASLTQSGASQVRPSRWEVVYRSANQQVVVLVEEGGGISRVIALRQ